MSDIQRFQIGQEVWVNPQAFVTSPEQYKKYVEYPWIIVDCLRQPEILEVWYKLKLAVDIGKVGEGLVMVCNDQSIDEVVSE